MANNKIEIIEELKNLTNQINLRNININQIKSNVNKLCNIYSRLKEIWVNININITCFFNFLLSQFISIHNHHHNNQSIPLPLLLLLVLSLLLLFDILG